MQKKVCSMELVPAGTMKQFFVSELEVVVVNLGGQIYCLDGRCSHAGAPLSEGSLAGEVLTCPWHGSQFNVTDGSVLRGPTEKPLKVYPSNVKDGFVFIDI